MCLQSTHGYGHDADGTASTHIYDNYIYIYVCICVYIHIYFYSIPVQNLQFPMKSGGKPTATQVHPGGPLRLCRAAARGGRRFAAATDAALWGATDAAAGSTGTAAMGWGVREGLGVGNPKN